MELTLAARLTRTFAALIAVTVLLSLVMVEFFANDIEESILHLELKEDAAHFREQLANNEFVAVNTSRLDVLFQPEDAPPSALPGFLQDIQPPYSREVYEDGKTLLIRAEATDQPPGTLFLVQDITQMEGRELLTQLALLAIAVTMTLIGLFLARATSQYLVSSLKKLGQDVATTKADGSVKPISTSYRDREVMEIAEAFNRFLTALEAHVHREKAFVKLASHELRSPLSVIAGAAEILARRETLSDTDRRILGRITRSVEVMQSDTDVLLELARQEGQSIESHKVSINQTIQNTVTDLENGNSHYLNRIEFSDMSPDLCVYGNPALVRMLLRNLIQNALRYTQGPIKVTLQGHQIHIRDFGQGLPNGISRRFDRQPAAHPYSGLPNLQTPSFGLLIVQLACEKLGWSLELLQSNEEGTEFCIHLAPTSLINGW